MTTADTKATYATGEVAALAGVSVIRTWRTPGGHNLRATA